MLNNQKIDIERVGNGGLSINNFLQPKNNGLDMFKFQFTGVADQKFITKLAKLIETETKPKDGQGHTTKQDK